jgi:hypothetical protein
MRHNPQTNYADIIAFLEANQDMVERSPELASEQAWALSHVGRLMEAEAINRRLLETRDNSGDLLLETNIALQLGAWERFPAIINRVWPTRETLDPDLLIRLASFAAEADTIPRALELAKLAIITGQELVQNHHSKSRPGCLEDAVVHRRLIQKKRRQDAMGGGLASSPPLEL